VSQFSPTILAVIQQALEYYGDTVSLDADERELVDEAQQQVAKEIDR
jgi:hypothetical protein